MRRPQKHYYPISSVKVAYQNSCKIHYTVTEWPQELLRQYLFLEIVKLFRR